MAKRRLCTDCIHNNNGWCEARKTNQGLRDLSIYSKGIVKGLEIALAIIKEK